jgi:hypothetical protein
MLTRLLGVILLSAAAIAVWYVRPTRSGYKYPKQYSYWLNVLSPFVIALLVALGVLLLVFGTLDPRAIIGTQLV